MIEIYREEEINRKKWIELANNATHTSYFQTYDSYLFFKSLSFLKTFAFGLEEKDDLKVVATGYIVSDGNSIKQYFSRRAVVLGGLLLDGNVANETLTIFLETITKELRNKAIYLEIRNFTNYSDYRETFTACGFSYQSHLNFHVPTTDVDTAFQQLNTTKRRDVRISLKNGATVEDTKDLGNVREFYLILSDLYQNKVKTPLFPEEFFTKAILEN
ncbi:MAG: GNAT family N-acetyltransferase, partial [Dysgonomonas sp.]